MSTHRQPSRVGKAVLAVVTSLALLGAFALLAVARMPRTFVDGASAAASASHRIVQQRLESYCPAGMELSDSTDWGDSEYRASTGDLATASTYAAFGSVYASTATALDVLADASATVLSAPENPTSRNAMVGRDDTGVSRVAVTNLLEAGDGSGMAGVVASHASEGDLRGISAATCTAPAMEQSFLLTATSTGVSQRLVLANPSSKATTVSIEVRGTAAVGAMTLSTGGTATVAAESESVVDLSAAASGQDGLYVTVSSKDAPVGAVVRTVAADGLTPKGSDFAMPAAEASDVNAIASVQEGDATVLYLYGAKKTTAHVSWITDGGLKDAGDHETSADRVDVVDLGKAPDGARGLLVESDEPLRAMASATRSGEDGQQDFAILPASASAAASGAALPEGFDAKLTFVNASDEDATVTLAFMDETGKAGEEREVDVPAHAGVAVDGEGSAAYVEDASDSVSWGVRLSGAGLDPDVVAGLSATAPTALAVREETVRSTPDGTLVR